MPDKFPAYKMVHIYPTTIEYESRIVSMTGALCGRRDIAKIAVVGFPSESLDPTSMMNSKTTVYRVGPVTKSGRGSFSKIMSFLAWYGAVLRKGKAIKPDFVNCHSISALPVSVFLAKTCKATLIYEPHELETETLTMRGWRKSLAKILEARLIRKAELVIAVSASTAAKYSSDYGIDKVHFIRNVPKLVEHRESKARSDANFRSKFAISDEDIIFLYQGALAPGRGVEVILDAFKTADSGRHVVFMGFGVLEEMVRQTAAKYANIHFHSPVPSDQVLEYTVGADVGIAFLDRSCLNHDFALPNKFFQYLHAGKPVLCTNLTEMSKIVSDFRVGWLAEPDTASMLASINAINLSETNDFRDNIPNVNKVLNWQREEERLNEIYDELLGCSR